MKVYLMRAFDLSRFKEFRPNPAGFTHKQAADDFCELHSIEGSSVLYSYDEVEISEVKNIKPEEKENA